MNGFPILCSRASIRRVGLASFMSALFSLQNLGDPPGFRCDKCGFAAVVVMTLCCG